MSNQFALFGSRRFMPMFFTQFFGAFNDNVFKQGLILLLTYQAATKLAVNHQADNVISLLTNLAALLFVLPFFLFSALAGQLADKYDKAWLIRKIKLLEIVIMLFASVGFIFEQYVVLFVALFLLGTQSAFFGPVKYAYLPQNMREHELVGANGLFQMGTSLAILTGMIVAGFLVQQEAALWWLSALVLLVAVLGYGFAYFVPVSAPPQPNLTIDWNIFRISWHMIVDLYRLPVMWFTILGNSWFWFYGATFITQTPVLSKTLLYGNESVVIFLLTLFSVGTAIGSVLCKTFTKNQVSLKLLPFGVVGLTIFAVDLFFALSGLSIDGNMRYTISQLWQLPNTWRVFGDLFFLGFFGGIYIVPLYAFMQAFAPESHRARIIGANNIFNALFMVMSAIFAIIVLTMLHLSLSMLFAIMGFLNLCFGMWLFYKLKHFSP